MQIRYFIGIFLCILCFSCAKNGETKKKNSVHEEVKPVLTDEQQWQEEIKKDSILLQKVLDSAVYQVKLHRNEEVFTTRYAEVRDSFPFAKVDITLGKLFSEKHKHAIIRRATSGEIHYNIFHVSDDEVKEVLYHEQWEITYVSDTIRDINGDKIKDFVINSYGSSGCCLKAASQVYLLQDETQKFAEVVGFTNPTFFPKEGVIRGVNYGHPGETSMYTYKWNGAVVDTLEFVYFQKNPKGEKTGKIIRSNKKFYFDKSKDRVDQVLHKIPKEYRNIYGYDWFLGKI